MKGFDSKIRIANFVAFKKKKHRENKLLIMKINKENGIHTVLGTLETVYKGRGSRLTAVVWFGFFGFF